MITRNKATVTRYMDAFGRSDHAAVLACLTDDVVWEIPGWFAVRGRDGFDKHIEGDGFTGRPEISVTRLVEEDNVVIAEGAVRTQRTDGTVVDLAFCDVFELEDGLIRRLISYLMEIKPVEA